MGTGSAQKGRPPLQRGPGGSRRVHQRVIRDYRSRGRSPNPDADAVPSPRSPGATRQQQRLWGLRIDQEGLPPDIQHPRIHRLFFKKTKKQHNLRFDAKRLISSTSSCSPLTDRSFSDLSSAQARAGAGLGEYVWKSKQEIKPGRLITGGFVYSSTRTDIISRLRLTCHE